MPPVDATEEDRGMKLLIVDDHTLFRSGLAHLLQSLVPQPQVLESADLHDAQHTLDTQNDIELVLLDLHTTTAGGGIFSVTGDDAPSLLLAAEMSVPVIKGILSGLQGTTLHYFRGNHFATNFPVRAISFEAGEHNDPAAIELSLAATINLLRAVGCVRQEDVRTYHDTLLREAAGELPLLTELVYVHRISKDGSDGFVMKPGFSNFQKVSKGLLLASDNNGEILCPADGYLLLPLYQKQGDEGFFLIRDYKFPTAY